MNNAHVTKCAHERTKVGAGDLAQWLRALTVLLEGTGSILSPDKAAHDHLKQVPENPTPSSALHGH